MAGPTGQGGLELEQVGSIAGGVGAAGGLGGGATYMLGAIELADVPKNERLVFMTGLTASALPVAAPAAAGLLGTPFLDSFAGGVDFQWGSAPNAQPAPAAGLGTTPPAAAGAVELPSVSLYGDAYGTDALRAERVCVPLTRLDGSGLPSVTLRVNGVDVPVRTAAANPCPPKPTVPWPHPGRRTRCCAEATRSARLTARRHLTRCAEATRPARHAP